MSEGCVSSSVAPPVGTTALTFDHNGTARSYLISIPESYDESTPSPIVLAMHGAKGTGAKINATSDLPSKAGARGYIVVSPNAQNASVATGNGQIDGGVWNIVPAYLDPVTSSTSTSVAATLGTDDDLAFIDALFDSLESRLCIDTNREFATGKSSGAGMTTFIACQKSVRFAAVAPVAGVNMPKFCTGSAVPALITFHGDDDVPMPYNGNTVVGIPLGVPDVDSRLAEIATKDGCSSSTDSLVGTDVIHRTWICPEGRAVELYKVLGGGHTWPGEEPAGAVGLGRVTDTIDATDIMLDFFDAHPKIK